MSLNDGGHIILHCSSCRKNLVDIWITNPYIDVEWVAIANCCFCGDKSFSKKITGLFHIGGYGKIKNDEPDDDIPETVVDNTIIENNLLIINTKKV